VVLKDVHPSGQTIVTMLGLERPLQWTSREGSVVVEIPPLSVDELPCEHAYTIKLTHLDDRP
jgi:alpha-L-fucosidase